MSPYLAGGMFLAFIAWSGALFYGGVKYEGYKAGVEDAQHDLAQAQITQKAQEHVLDQTKQQNTDNQQASQAYAKSMSIIDNLYTIPTNSLQSKTPTTGNSLPGISKTPSGTSAIKSRTYGLTLKECDVEESKLIALWSDWNAQAAIK